MLIADFADFTDSSNLFDTIINLFIIQMKGVLPRTLIDEDLDTCRKHLKLKIRLIYS